ncbi:hypothetical protein AAFC00_001865 [Neodothiora populina]|uniref:U2 small nuclear ribonucleoprotein A' n=1 Tax=Neodothiora populina TaxID=2781224 RepID=A0ABR3PQE4_9PEZI
MRLTVDLVQNSLSYLNPLKERELDLRGHKIPALENLGLIRDQDAIDFTDNDIPTLANFPLMPRLQALYLARNRITTIANGLSKSIGNLHTLVLTQNQIAELADIEPLSGLKKLIHLSLVENPVTSKENYRYWVIARCPSVRFLDFSKVKDSERSKAKELFGSVAEPTELTQTILANRSNNSASAFSSSTNLNGSTSAKPFKLKLNEQEKARFGKLISNAKSLAEISKLEKDLNEGKLPPGVLDNDMDTTS